MAKLYFFADLTAYQKNFKDDMLLNDVTNLSYISNTYNFTYGGVRSYNINIYNPEVFRDENGRQYHNYYKDPINTWMGIDRFVLKIDNDSYEYVGNGNMIMEINVEPGFKVVQIEMTICDRIQNPDILKYKLAYKDGKSKDEFYKYVTEKRLVYFHKGNNFIYSNVSFYKEYIKLVKTNYVLSSTTTEAFFAGKQWFNSQECCKTSKVSFDVISTNYNGFMSYFRRNNPDCVIAKPVMPNGDNIVIPGNKWKSSNNFSSVNSNTSSRKKEVYPDGAWYEGEFLNGQRHGQGTFCWTNGTKYVGPFVNGNFHGEGIVYYTDGTSKKIIYEYGKIIKFLPNNLRETYDDGSWYEGEFCNGLRHGKGKYTWSDGAFYIGDWVKGHRTGKGKMTWADGTNYEGEFLNNKRHGKGRHVFANKNVYEGEFVDDVFQGKGKYIWADGTIYEGEFKNFNRHGKGKQFFTNKNVYEGDYVDGFFHGKGKFIWSDGTIYDGDWVKDHRTGTGIMMWPDGGYYQGGFLNGKRHGKGKHIFSNKNIYEGDFVDDAFQGKGKFTWSDGTIYEGEYMNFNRHGQGTFIWPNGDKYIGGWKNGSMHGEGIIYYKTGVKEKVTCENGTYVNRIIIK